MLRFTKLAAFVAAVVVTAMGAAAPAQAQATRTWISGVGDDANPCSRTAPCRTWAGAISKTAQGGEIDALDPGGFGAVTITKSITLDGTGGGIGGVLVAGQNGVIINDGGAGAASVTLRHLDIEGLGFSTTSPGIRGIWFASGAFLQVQRCTIRGFRDPSNGWGIFIGTSTTAKIAIEDSNITGNGVGGSGGGIGIQPSGTASVVFTLNNVRLDNNFNNSFKIDMTGLTGTLVKGSIVNSQFSGSTGGITVVAPTSSTATVNIDSSVVSNNAVGILSNGAFATAIVGRSVITTNGTGLIAAAGAKLNTYGDNSNDGNGAPGTPTLPALPRT